VQEETAEELARATSASPEKQAASEHEARKHVTTVRIEM